MGKTQSKYEPISSHIAKLDKTQEKDPELSMRLEEMGTSIFDNKLMIQVLNNLVSEEVL
jgi:hypothetical protein